MTKILRKIFPVFNLPLTFFSCLLFFELTSESTIPGPISGLWILLITYGLVLTFFWSFITAFFIYDRTKDRQVFYSLLVPLFAAGLTFIFNMTRKLERTIMTQTYAMRNDENGLESIRLLSDSTFIRINNELEASFITEGKFNIINGKLFLTSETNKKPEATDTLLIDKASIYQLSVMGDTILIYRIEN